MQAKQLPDHEALHRIAGLAEAKRGYPHPVDTDPPVSRWQVEETFAQSHAAPVKVTFAKLRRLTKRGLLAGCTCGCRGDFTLTERGRSVLSIFTP